MGNIAILDLLKTSLAMDVLILMSIVTVAVAIERWWFFKRTGIDTGRLTGTLRQHLRKGNGSAALETLSRERAPVARVAETLLQNTSLPREEFEKAVNGRIESETVNMERNLIVLGTMSNIAPLMGLFGTVVGIIRSFRDIAVTGSGGSSVIAMGVSEALLTTAVGIVIAVIATVFYNTLIRRIRVRVNQMEEVRQELTALLVRPRTQAPAPRSADGHPQRRAA